ncbi:MAG: hypothetical protein H0V01_03870 [Bacteroidetes bacterium]|nr:hypothetical protein [Bacteroidota bacterium]HET6243553.1 hypothetical protein [Bacteroidia bacterium]
MKIKEITLFLIFPLLCLTGCKNNETEKEVLDYTWKSEQKLAYTDINNPLQGYSLGDKEALDTAFAAFILQSTGKTTINYSDAEGNKISPEQAKELLTQRYVLLVPDPEQPELKIEEMQEIHLAPNDIVQVLCRENWYLNEPDFKLSKKITHIAPVVYVYDHDGDVRGKKVLFWMEMK